jgi:hypothetical protein
MPEIWGKLTFRPNLCYFSTCEKNWLREEDSLGDFSQAKRSQKPLFDCGDSDCRIISVHMSERHFPPPVWERSLKTYLSNWLLRSWGIITSYNFTRLA